MRATSSPRRPSTSTRRTRPRRSTRGWSRWAWTFCSTPTPRSSPARPPSGRPGDGDHVRILITGGAWFLGSHLAEAWLDRGDEVTVLDPAADLKVRHLRANPRFRMIRESVLHRDILEGLVAWCDLVYHLAAVVGVEHYVGDPYQVLTVNINGTQEALTAAFRHQKKVVFSSTSEIYGGSPAVPIDEKGHRRLGSTLIGRR